ncbi:MAG: TIGR00159 family protein [Proteobacteria bacterium]|nr:MAG: TIGR00159 family protein [Pseudomonadota bacterium]
MLATVMGWLSGVPWASVLLGALDIVIVAALIYRVLLLIRGTRAAYMLIGLLGVVGVYLLAKQLSLGTVGWLLDRILGYALLIVIVVFQSEIRRGLLRMGRRLINPRRVAAARDKIEQLASACETMAIQRVGALIVVEREVDVSALIEAGTATDAEVSEQLLTAIFAPSAHNPLHDGAALIHGDRLRRAGALLPLSRCSTLERELGTRHRAALGVTEETDAIALVVSEERGTISLCFGGCLERDLDRVELRRRLGALLGCRAHKSREPTFIERAARYLVVGDEPESGDTSRVSQRLGSEQGGGVQ